MKTNVRTYEDHELLNHVKNIEGYEGIPNDYWMIFVRSNEDETNSFDDKCYIFKGEIFQTVTSCTTNSGSYGLKNFFKWRKEGVAVLSSNRWYVKTWENGLHKGRMKAWVQTLKKVLVYRDNDKDGKSEQLGTPEWGFFGINIHTVTYGLADIVKTQINGWSVGCLVFNVTKKYRSILKEIQDYQTDLTVVLIDEF